MTTTFLSNIGNSSDLRAQISQTDIRNTVSLILDKPRTLEVRTKNFGKDELTVRCKDAEEQWVSIVLHLPLQGGAVASATIIYYTTESSST